MRLCRCNQVGTDIIRELFPDWPHGLLPAKPFGSGQLRNFGSARGNNLLLTGKIYARRLFVCMADRAITLTLPAIINKSRKREYELWQEFDNECPRILGVLLDAVSCALRRLPEVNLESSPRMVDLAHWVTAAEPGLG